MRFTLPLPRHGTVVAYLALGVALSGTAYAATALPRNSVRSVQIKNGQVKTADIARSAVKSSSVADGSLLARDFRPGQVPAGPRGLQGLQGPKGEAGATNVSVRAVSAMGEAIARCPTGSRATGGGADSLEGLVVGQGPTDVPLAFFAPPLEQPAQDYTPTAWSAAARDDAGDPADVTAWVVCAAP
jgi:hypothetical protein